MGTTFTMAEETPEATVRRLSRALAETEAAAQAEQARLQAEIDLLRRGLEKAYGVPEAPGLNTAKVVLGQTLAMHTGQQREHARVRRGLCPRCGAPPGMGTIPVGGSGGDYERWPCPVCREEEFARCLRR